MASPSHNGVPQMDENAQDDNCPVADALDRMAESFAESLDTIREGFLVVLRSHRAARREALECERHLQETMQLETLESERRLQEAMQQQVLECERRIQEAVGRFQAPRSSVGGEGDVPLPPAEHHESSEGLEARMRSLEDSLQTALSSVVPKVDRLLEQVEMRGPPLSLPDSGASREEALFQAVRAGQLDRVRSLLDDGADVNCRDCTSLTPLHLAASAGYADVVRLLAAWGADLDAPTVFGYAPLHFAVQMDLSGRCVAELIALGADVNKDDEHGATPLHLATRLGRVKAMEALTAAGGRV